jgi:phospholipid-binding lipoprotein MlaA
VPRSRTAAAEDPWEGVNRKTYAINSKLDKVLFRPVALTYRHVLPRAVRKGVHNALRNWDEPGVAVNDLLQRHFKDAGRATGRFLINSTVGLLGVFDVAARNGLEHHENGFGITLGREGIKAGPYVYLPFFGPSSVRDSVGSVVDLFTNPLTFIRGARTAKIERIQTVVTVVDARADVEEDLQSIALSATDPYATLRSVYLQKVEAQVSGDDFFLGDSPEIPGAPELPHGKKGKTDPVESAPPPTPAETPTPK